MKMKALNIVVALFVSVCAASSLAFAATLDGAQTNINKSSAVTPIVDSLLVSTGGLKSAKANQVLSVSEIIKNTQEPAEQMLVTPAASSVREYRAVSNEAELHDAIAWLMSGQSDDYSYLDIKLTADITLTKPLSMRTSTIIYSYVSIYGDGHTLSFSNDAAISVESSVKLTLGSSSGSSNSITLTTTPSYRSSSSLITVNGGGYLTTYSGVVIDGRNESYKASAITLNSDSSKVTYLLSGATIKNWNNTQGNGGAILLKGTGSHFEVQTPTYGNTFAGRIENCSAKNGGAISVEGKYSICNVTFSGNFEITNCRATSGYGGAIYCASTNTNMQIKYLKVSNCTAIEKGGAIAAMSPSSKVSLDNCEITGNIAQAKDGKSYGGGIYAEVPVNSYYGYGYYPYPQTSPSNKVYGNTAYTAGDDLMLAGGGGCLGLAPIDNTVNGKQITGWYLDGNASGSAPRHNPNSPKPYDFHNSTTSLSLAVKAGTCTDLNNIPVPIQKVELKIGDEVLGPNTSRTLNSDATLQLTATVNPANAYDTAIIWESSNPEVATVENGLVKPKKRGSCTITAKTASGKSAQCLININCIHIFDKWYKGYSGHYKVCSYPGCGVAQDGLEVSHTFTEKTILPTPTETGLRELSCDICGYVKETTILDADCVGHIFEGAWGEDDEDKPHKEICKLCGKTVNKVGFTGWNYEEVSIATMTDPGLIRYHCPTCNLTYDKKIAAICNQGNTLQRAPWQHDDKSHWKQCSETGEGKPHRVFESAHGNWQYEAVRPATEEHSGLERYTCGQEGCGYSFERTLPAYCSHNSPSANWFFDDDTGHWKVCTVPECGKQLTRYPHNYDWVTILPATPDQDGKAQITCKDCGFQTIIPVSVQCVHGGGKLPNWASDQSTHWKPCISPSCPVKYEQQMHDYEWTPTKYATATQSGEAKLVCRICGNEQVKTVPALCQHNRPAATFTYDGNMHWKECLDSSCGLQLYAAPHDLESKVAIMPTATTTGLRTDKCKTCDYSIDVVVPATGASSSGSIGGSGGAGGPGGSGAAGGSGNSGSTLCAHIFRSGFDAISHFQMCSLCGEKRDIEDHKISQYDQSAHWGVCDICHEQVPSRAHNIRYITTKTTHKSYCLTCGMRAEYAPHTFAWQSDGAFNHAYKCTTCGYTQFLCPTNNNFMWVPIKYATATNDGLQDRICKTCKWTTRMTVPALGGSKAGLAVPEGTQGSTNQEATLPEQAAFDLAPETSSASAAFNRSDDGFIIKLNEIPKETIVISGILFIVAAFVLSFVAVFGVPFGKSSIFRKRSRK